MKKSLIIAIILLSSVAVSRGQVASLVTITPDARSAGMGDTGISASANAFSVFGYTAAIALEPGTAAFGYSYTPWMRSHIRGYNLHSAAGYWRPGDRHGIALGFRYFNSPTVRYTDDNGNLLNEFRPADMAVDLGYAYAITDELGVAVNARGVYSDLSNYPGTESGLAFAGDLSVYYRKDDLSAGLSVSNLGSKMKYGNDDDGTFMPANIKLGGAYRMPLGSDMHVITGALEAGYSLLPSENRGVFGGIGVEYMFNGFIAVRGGYHAASKVVGSSYGTAGLGINLDIFSVDFSYLIAGADSSVRNTMRFSLGVKF